MLFILHCYVLQTNIANWLNILELGMYKEMFHDAGYEMEEDMENLKKLDEKKLIGIGVNKRGEYDYDVT